MRVALLAPFADFDPAYSLAHVVCQQAELLRRGGHDVELWTHAGASRDNGLLQRLHADVRVVKAIPHGEWKYGKLTANAARTAEALMSAFFASNPNVVVAHDVCFQAWYTDVGFAVHQLQARTTSAKWFHWLHSSPSTTVVDHDSAWRTRIPDGHFIIVPSPALLDVAAQRYNVASDRVFTVPNAHDSRWISPCSPAVDAAITQHRLMERDAVQVYPLCLTRMHEKGVDDVLGTFSALKRLGQSVLLIVAGANGSAEGTAEKVDALRKRHPDLTPADLIFTHEWPEWENGVPHTDVMQLMARSNVFVFPSRAEACPLVLLEALQHNCTIVVNADVPSQVDMAPHAIRHSFGGIDLRPRAVEVDAVKCMDRPGGDAPKNYAALAEQIAAAVAGDQRRVTARRYGYEAVRQRLHQVITAAQSRDGATTIKHDARANAAMRISVAKTLLMYG